LGKNAFLARTVVEWNGLDDEQVGQNSIMEFKGSLRMAKEEKKTDFVK
jgi:hypothetical protein